MPRWAMSLAYVKLADTNPGIPSEEGIVPVLIEKAVPLHEVIPVDHFLPGCPPPAPGPARRSHAPRTLCVRGE